MVADDDARNRLLAAGWIDGDIRMRHKCEHKLADYNGPFLNESHPAKDEEGSHLYDFAFEFLKTDHLHKP